MGIFCRAGAALRDCIDALLLVADADMEGPGRSQALSDRGRCLCACHGCCPAIGPSANPDSHVDLHPNADPDTHPDSDTHGGQFLWLVRRDRDLRRNGNGLGRRSRGGDVHAGIQFGVRARNDSRQLQRDRCSQQHAHRLILGDHSKVQISS